MYNSTLKLATPPVLINAYNCTYTLTGVEMDAIITLLKNDSLVGGAKMNIIRRIALPFGIVGGIWGLLAPVVMALISPAWAFERVWWYLPLISFVT